MESINFQVTLKPATINNVNVFVTQLGRALFCSNFYPQCFPEIAQKITHYAQ